MNGIERACLAFFGAIIVTYIIIPLFYKITGWNYNK